MRWVVGGRFGPLRGDQMRETLHNNWLYPNLNRKHLLYSISRNSRHGALLEVQRFGCHHIGADQLFPELFRMEILVYAPRSGTYAEWPLDVQ